MVSNFYCRIIAFYMFFTFGHGFRIFFKRKDEEYYKFKLIFPGTKWCGTGNIAETFEDVGVGCSFETDKCCRDHDQCGDIIEAGQSKYNLINDSIFTRLNCKCDEQFYDCLKSSSKLLSRIIGNIYFNVLKNQCYRKDFPIVKCVKYHSKINNRCVEYELDESKPPIYEWFDVPPF